MKSEVCVVMSEQRSLVSILTKSGIDVCEVEVKRRGCRPVE